MERIYDQKGLNYFGYYTNYLSFKYDCSLKELANQLGVPYNSLAVLRHGSGRKPSKELLTKIGKLVDLKDYEVYYSMLKLNVLDSDSIALFYLSKKHTDGFSITWNYIPPKYFDHVRDLIFEFEYSFGGVYNAPGKSRNYILVDSWKNLKNQFFEHYYGLIHNLSYNSDTIDSKFRSEASYYWSVLNYGFQKTQLLVNPNYYKYVVLCETLEEYDKINKILPDKTPIKFEVEVIPFIDEYNNANNTIPLDRAMIHLIRQALDNAKRYPHNVPYDIAQNYIDVAIKVIGEIQSNKQLERCALFIVFKNFSDKTTNQDLISYLKNYKAKLDKGSYILPNSIFFGLARVIEIFCPLLKDNDSEVLNLVTIDDAIFEEQNK